MLILEANDTIAPVQPKPGTQVLIPSQMLLPDVPREGIVVNLAELRLYYFPPGENQVQVYPLGIGQLGLETPEMTTRVGQKIPNPTLDAYRRHPRALAGERGDAASGGPGRTEQSWAAMRCVWPTVTVNISSTELTPQTALVCASARAVCG